MAVDDHGLEVLKKSGEEVTPGDKSDMYVKVAVVPGAGLDLATETTLQSVLNAVDQLEGFTDGIEGLITSTNSLLTLLNGYVDGLESFTDGLEGSLSSIDGKVSTEAKQDAQIALLSALNGYVDGLEGLLATLNSTVSTASNQVTTHSKLEDIKTLLTTLNGYVDQLEGYVDGIEGFVDGIEALITSSNALLTTIRDNTDQLEGYLDTVESLLTGPTTSALSSVSASASTVSLLAANSNRRGFVLYNDSTQPCYVAYAATATASAFTIRMAANSLYESPIPSYKGDISGIWGVAVGAMRITELTP